MLNTSHPARVAITLAAGAVSLVVLAVPSLAVADAGRGVDLKAPNTGSGQEQPRSPGRSARSTTWWEALGPSRAGHQQEVLYPPDSSRFDAVRMVPRTPSPAGSASTVDQSPPAYAQIALGGLGGATIAAAVAGTLRGRRRRKPVLEAALAAGGPDEMSRAAGLLGDRLVQHRHTDAAAYAYRAAVDVGHEYWSPIAQVALARLLTDQGDRQEARALMEDVVASGHSRAAPVAEAGLGELTGGRKGMAGSAPDRSRWERLGDAVDQPGRSS